MGKPFVVNREDIIIVAEKVQQNTGYMFSGKELGDIVEQTHYKCLVKNKDSSYFLLILEDELVNYLIRHEINKLSQRTEHLIV
jgi:hypothetical protein